MGWHGGLLSSLAVMAAFSGGARQMHVRPETSKKKKAHTELRRERKRQRQMRKKSRA